MIVAGSSLEVAPAGDLPEMAREHGARLIIINYLETHLDEQADVVIRADVAEMFGWPEPFLPRLAPEPPRRPASRRQVRICPVAAWMRDSCGDSLNY